MNNNYTYKYKCRTIFLKNVRILNFKDYMEKNNLKDYTMNESELRRVYNHNIYPRDSKKLSDKGSVKVHNGSEGGTHWTCFKVNDDKSFYFDSFGGQPDKFLLNQLPKPITYHSYKIQNENSKLCGSYCLTFFIWLKEWNNMMLL